MSRFRLSELAHSALEIYVFDPCVVEGAEAMGEPAFPGHIDGCSLVVTDPQCARTLLTDAANSADCDDERHPREGFGRLRDALTQLARRQ